MDTTLAVAMYRGKFVSIKPTNCSNQEISLFFPLAFLVNVQALSLNGEIHCQFTGTMALLLADMRPLISTSYMSSNFAFDMSESALLGSALSNPGAYFQVPCEGDRMCVCVRARMCVSKYIPPSSSLHVTL